MVNNVRQMFVGLVLAVMVSACASLGLAPAETFRDRLAYAYGTNAAVADSTATSFQAGTVDRDTATYVLKITSETLVALDAAGVAYGAGDIATAEGRVALAVNVLQQLQAYLRSKGVN